MNLAFIVGVITETSILATNEGAGKALDGRTDESNCVLLPFINEKQSQTWWKLWLQRKFNIAYIEIYFRSDSKYEQRR